MPSAKKIRLCIDCVHFADGEPPTCERTRQVIQSLVDGTERTFFRSCEDERGGTGFDSFRCGPSGMCWEKKETGFPEYC